LPGRSGGVSDGEVDLRVVERCLRSRYQLDDTVAKVRMSGARLQILHVGVVELTQRVAIFGELPRSVLR
jgi:hypothetical protein